MAVLGSGALANVVVHNELKLLLHIAVLCLSEFASVNATAVLWLLLLAPWDSSLCGCGQLHSLLTSNLYKRCDKLVWMY